MLGTANTLKNCTFYAKQIHLTHPSPCVHHVQIKIINQENAFSMKSPLPPPPPLVFQLWQWQDGMMTYTCCPCLQTICFTWEAILEIEHHLCDHGNREHVVLVTLANTSVNRRTVINMSCWSMDQCFLLFHLQTWCHIVPKRLSSIHHAHKNIALVIPVNSTLCK